MVDVEHRLAPSKRTRPSWSSTCHDRRGVGDVGLEPVPEARVPRSSWRSSCGSFAKGRSISRLGSIATCRSSCEGSFRYTGPASGCRAARPCPHSTVRSRVASSRSEAHRACLARLIEQLVVGHDQVGVGRYPQSADVDVSAVQLRDLVGEHLRVDDDVAADRAELGVEDPEGDQVELEHLTVPNDRVRRCCRPGSGSRGPRARQAGRRPCPCLIAPLGADDHNTRHGNRASGARAPVLGAPAPHPGRGGGHLCPGRRGRRP